MLQTLGWCKTIYCIAALVSLMTGGCASWSRPVTTPYASLPPTSAKNPGDNSEVLPASAEQPVWEASDDDQTIFPLEEEKESDFWGILSELSPAKTWKRFKNLIGLGPDERLAQKYYEEGYALFKERKFLAAGGKFKWAAFRWPESTLEEDALFMRGESYFFADHYSKANDTYSRLMKKYENSRHTDKVVQRYFAIGRYWEQLAKTHSNWAPNFIDKKRPLFDLLGNAIASYEGVRLNDPRGPLADDAVMATANAYFQKEYYDESSYYYELLRKDYPQSEHQPQAHLLAISSHMLSYQGPEYDGRTLEKARELVNQTLANFSQELAVEQPRLLKTKEKIENLLAEREFYRAEYYYNLKYYRAARFHYAAVLKEYPQTALASPAKQRMDETRDYAPVPDDPWQWVAELLGEPQKLER